MKLTTQIQDGLLLLFGHTAGIGECLYCCIKNNNVCLSIAHISLSTRVNKNTNSNSLHFFFREEFVFFKGWGCSPAFEGGTHLHFRGWGALTSCAFTICAIYWSRQLRVFGILNSSWFFLQKFAVNINQFMKNKVISEFHLQKYKITFICGRSILQKFAVRIKQFMYNRVISEFHLQK